MSLLSKDDINHALQRLGELAQERGHAIELLAVGGAVMVLAYDARPSTHDVDAVILSPAEAKITRQLAEQVAVELDWPLDWLNDSAKNYLMHKPRADNLFVGGYCCTPAVRGSVISHEALCVA